MSDEMSARLGLPLLRAGQAQKEVSHNAALALLDLAVAPAVQAVGLDMPPPTPGEGMCWIVGTVPGDAWSGQAGALAGWTAGGWRFVAPLEGMAVWSIADDVQAIFRDGAWLLGELCGARLVLSGAQVVGARRAAIAEPAGGSTLDGEARVAITAILEALRGHGLIET